MRVWGSNSKIWRAVAVAAVSSTASPVWAQHLAGGASPDISVVRVVVALFVSLVIGLGLLIAHRRLPGRSNFGQVLGKLAGELGSKRRIDVLEARRISPHADVCLVRCDTDEYVILCGPAGSKVLRKGRVSQVAAVGAVTEELPR